MRKGLTLLMIAGLQGLAHAAAGTEGASFLDIPVGAGPAALGSAYTSLATNAYAPVWNPAGLGSLTGNEIGAQHLAYLDSIHYEFLSFVHPLGAAHGSETHRGIGFSVQYLGSGTIDRTDVNTDGSLVNGGNPIGTFSSYYASYNLSYGQTVTDKLSLGVTGKMIRAKIDDVSAGAFAGDVGGLYKVNSKAQIGASMVNMGSKLKFISEGDDLPLAFKLGAAFQPSTHFLLSAEGVYRKNGLASFHTGTEWRPIEAIGLRAGYKTDTLKGLNALAGLTAGIGLHVWGQEFAYAWAPYGDLGDAQYISLLIHFGSEEEQKRNLIQYQNIKRHRTVKSTPKADSEPEYQMLMQLLAQDDLHTAQAVQKGEENQ